MEMAAATDNLLEMTDYLSCIIDAVCPRIVCAGSINIGKAPVGIDKTMGRAKKSGAVLS